MRESSIVADIQKRVRAAYPRAYVRKLADRHTRGVPDLLIIFRASDGLAEWGSTLLVEVKASKGKQSRLQEVEQREVEVAGGNYLLARSADYVLSELERLGAFP